MATDGRVRGEALDRRLADLMKVEMFPPPREFTERALVSDESLYEEAARDPAEWWASQARELIDWSKPFTQACDWSDPPHVKWFADGELNVSYNCLDRHVEAGRGDRVAFHWRGEEGEERDVTYAELHRDVQRFANALKARGVGKGDVVGIYVPMIPEVVVAMLACARIGAVHNVVFGGFSAESVRDRMAFSEA
jgi:acetyl-CoA synthetase